MSLNIVIPLAILLGGLIGFLGAIHHRNNKREKFHKEMEALIPKQNSKGISYELNRLIESDGGLGWFSNLRWAIEDGIRWTDEPLYRGIDKEKMFNICVKITEHFTYLLTRKNHKFPVDINGKLIKGATK